jgi:hypothetical protein
MLFFVDMVLDFGSDERPVSAAQAILLTKVDRSCELA